MNTLIDIAKINGVSNTRYLILPIYRDSAFFVKKKDGDIADTEKRICISIQSIATPKTYWNETLYEIDQSVLRRSYVMIDDPIILRQSDLSDSLLGFKKKKDSDVSVVLVNKDKVIDLFSGSVAYHDPQSLVPSDVDIAPAGFYIQLSPLIKKHD